jgi:hypothetical protein
MMNATGSTVVQVLSGPTRQMLRRSCGGVVAVVGVIPSAENLVQRSEQYACLAPLVTYCLKMVANDRREFQRLHLAKPILALMDGQNALILDIGVGGAYIEHYGALPEGAQFRLLFRWQGGDVEFLCEVRRSHVVRTGGDQMSLVSHSGVRFLEGIGAAESRLNDMMATFVGRVLAAQRANASGKAESEALSLSQLGGARRARSRGWITFRLVNGLWRRELAHAATQPPNGFTVAAYEDEDELATLCETYEASDEEGRRMIRLLAELSAKNAVV